MAVFGTRIFLSLHKDESIPATLVSLPTSSASSSSPKLTPFPSWGMQEYGNCDKIEQAAGLEVDAVGRLWVLDDGSCYCNNSKLWIFDLSNNDKIQLIHYFPFRYNLHDLVLDETPNGYFAYITRWGDQDIVVFSLERNESWIVKTPGMKIFSIALSPKEEPRQLYLTTRPSYRLLKAAVGAKPYTNEPSKSGQTDNSVLIGLLTFFLVLSCTFNLWLYMRMRKLQNCNEQRNTGVVEMEMHPVPNSFSPKMHGGRGNRK
ncbi:Hypothetical predicted protein [Cloeon dipterum]|uniref:Uncharacterized protein n=1 Tax=Cloeon dipterum TaxID=197152 RepID=A0A8S1DC10_9INSE|nr:Hypothetical predicted protein [Cloeon dipterum]